MDAFPEGYGFFIQAPHSKIIREICSRNQCRVASVDEGKIFVSPLIWNMSQDRITECLDNAKIEIAAEMNLPLDQIWFEDNYLSDLGE